MKIAFLKPLSVISVLAVTLSTALTAAPINAYASESGPVFKGYQGSSLYICDSESNLITDNGFESGDGNWNTSDFINSSLSVCEDSTAVSGKSSLRLRPTGASNVVKSVFYVNVEANTDYYFTCWVKGEAYSNTNKADMTFGIINPETGSFLASTSGTDIDRRFTSILQLCPLSWDGEWHITGIGFNSGNAERVGVAIHSVSSMAYFDDMYLVKATQAKRYTSPIAEIEAVTVASAEPDLLKCDNDSNLVENFDFSDSGSDYWQTGLGYGENVTVTDASYTVGNTLRYIQSDSPEHKYYIKYVNVKPNIFYTLSAEYCVLKNGDGAFGAIDGSTYLPKDIARFSFSDIEVCTWKNRGVSFNSGGHTRIGIFVYDGGGEALIDNIYLFEQHKANTKILNGGFEDGLSFWHWNNFGVSDTVVYSGEDSLILNDGNTEYQQTFQFIDLTPNTDYVFSFYYYAPQGSDSWAVGLLTVPIRVLTL